jgi:hypothetical protein
LADSRELVRVARWPGPALGERSLANSARSCALRGVGRGLRVGEGGERGINLTQRAVKLAQRAATLAQRAATLAQRAATLAQRAATLAQRATRRAERSPKPDRRSARVTMWLNPLLASEMMPTRGQNRACSPYWSLNDAQTPRAPKGCRTTCDTNEAASSPKGVRERRIPVQPRGNRAANGHFPVHQAAK